MYIALKPLDDVAVKYVVRLKVHVVVAEQRAVSSTTRLVASV